MPAYYNEHDHGAAEWLRELIRRGLIACGDVDERSIEDVTPNELLRYEQCHFFAGIGTWSYALRCAGWPDDRPVWTGSCPCQPFSAAGKGEGFADDRHLWPAWFWLIKQSRPEVIFGEQVASKDGLAWIDLVQSNLEGENYSTAAFDLCAAGFGAPHKRSRLYFVADADLYGDWREVRGRYRKKSPVPEINWEGVGCTGKLSRTGGNVYSGQLADANGAGLEGATGESVQRGESGLTIDRTNGFWRDAEWLQCSDGKQRPTKPGIHPLAHGPAARVVRLRGYGNAIVAPVAAEFIKSYMDVRG